jgi:hypothetical protein
VNRNKMNRQKQSTDLNREWTRMYANESRRGIVPVVVVALVAACAALGWAGIHFNLFASAKPDVAGLSTDQQKLALAQAAAAEAQAQLDAAKAAATSQQLSQVRNAQQMVAGATAAVTRAPVGPETALAGSLLIRANTGLAAAIGDLPSDKQAEIQAIVGEALSKSADQVATAQATLATKDIELKTATAARIDAETKATALASTVQHTAAQATAAENALTAKTDEVKAWAEAKAASDAKGSLLSGEVSSLVKWGLLLGSVYFAIHYLLPILVQTFPQHRFLTGVYNFLVALVSAHEIALPAAASTATPTATALPPVAAAAGLFSPATKS